MFNIVETTAEQQAILTLCLGKINELYTLLKFYQESEDKLLASFALKNTALYIHNLIVNGKYVVDETVKTAEDSPSVPSEKVNSSNTAEPIRSDAGNGGNEHAANEGQTEGNDHAL